MSIQLTPKQLKRRSIYEEMNSAGNLGVTKVIFELMDEIENLKTELETVRKDIAPNLKDVLEQVKGTPGYTPVKGKDYRDGVDGNPGTNGENYVLTPADKKEIAQSIKVPVVEKVIIEKHEVVIEQPIIKTEIVKETTVEKNLSTEQLALVQKEFDSKLKEVKDQLSTIPRGTVGGSRPIKILSSGTAVGGAVNEINFTGATITTVGPSGKRVTVALSGGGVGAWSTPVETPVSDGSVTVFTVGSSAPTDVVSDGSFLYNGAGYTFAAGQITFTNGPTQFVRYR